MRVLIDACIDPRIVEGFPTHSVTTAAQIGWQKFKDHELIQRLQTDFDVLVTIDQGFEFEHNLSKLKFGIVILHVAKNKLVFYRPLFPSIHLALESLTPGSVRHIPEP